MFPLTNSSQSSSPSPLTSNSPKIFLARSAAASYNIKCGKQKNVYYTLQASIFQQLWLIILSDIFLWIFHNINSKHTLRILQLFGCKIFTLPLKGPTFVSFLIQVHVNVLTHRFKKFWILCPFSSSKRGSQKVPDCYSMVSQPDPLTL